MTALPNTILGRMVQTRKLMGLFWYQVSFFRLYLPYNVLTSYPLPKGVFPNLQVECPIECVWEM